MLQSAVAAREEHDGPAQHARGFRYINSEDFVLVNGVDFDPTPLTADERAYVDSLVAAQLGTPKPQACYSNSLMLAAGDREGRLQYVEGYCLETTTFENWFLHGWLSLGGKVVDVTLGVYGNWTDIREYFGVTFPKPYLAKSMARCLELGIPTGSLVDFWEAGWPLRKGEPWQ